MLVWRCRYIETFFSADSLPTNVDKPNIIGVPQEGDISVQDALIEITTDEAQVETPLLYEKPNLAAIKGFFPLNDERWEGLTREYLHPKLEFVTDTDHQGAPCGVPLQPDLMPMSIIRKFSYFRTDWHIRLQVIAPAMEFGYLEGYCEPLNITVSQPFYKLLSSATSHERFMLMSCTTGFTLSVNEQETMEFDLPWPFPGTMLSLASFASEAAFIAFLRNECWNIHLNGHALHKIQGGSEAASCAVLMYVSLKDPVLTGPSSGTEQWSATGLQATENMTTGEVTFIQAHGDRAANPLARMANTFNFDTVVTGGSAMLGAFLGEMQGTIIKRGAPAAVEFLSQEVQARLEGTQSKSEIVTTDSSVGNERNGVRQSVYGNTSAFAGSGSFQNLGDTHNTGIVDPHVCGLAGSLEHDFSTLIRRWSIFSDPLSGTAKAPRAYYVNPNWYEKYNAATTVYANFYGYLAWASTFYRMWRGSIQYKMELFGSPLVMAKVFISIFWTRTAFENAVTNSDFSNFSKDMLEAAGDVYTQTFTVKGRCTIQWEVPFLRPNYWARVNDLDQFTPIMAVSFQDVRPSQIDGTSVDIPNYIAIRAGDDFEFCSYTGGKSVLIGQPPLLAHGPGKEADKSESIDEPDIIEAHGFVNDDSEVLAGEGPINHTIGPSPVPYQISPTNFYQLLKRPSLHVANTYPPAPCRFPDMNNVSETTREEAYVLSRPIDKIGLCFLFWRGSLNHKMVFDSSNQGDSGFVADMLVCGMSNPNTSVKYAGTAATSMTTDYGAQLTETDIWPIIEVEFPYINTFQCSRTAARSTGQGPGLGILFSDPLVNMIAQRGDDPQSELPKQCVTSIGQDFRFYGLIPPPNLTGFEMYGISIYPPAQNLRTFRGR